MDYEHDMRSNLTVRMNPLLYKALKDYSKDKGVSASEVVRQLLGRILNMDHSLKKIPCILDDTIKD